MHASKRDRPRGSAEIVRVLVSISNIAEIGSLLGDPVRVSMMIALLDGRAWTARELAEIGGVTPQTASSHLAKLVEAKMVCVDRQGRRRYHRIASAEVAGLLEQMHVAGAALSAGSRPTQTFGPKDAALRELRSCYDHLAGRIAVELSDHVLAKDAHRGSPGLSREGAALLGNFGIDLKALEGARRTFWRPCLDWSERRPHIAGALGAAILQRMRELGWVRSRINDRSLMLTATGERGLADLFGVAAVRTPA
jgi:DNA-binding transcriptional ArsR family regulator